MAGIFPENLWGVRRIAILGAGPIGLEAALAALERGYAVEIFERGAEANAVRRWGHVRMFSPFGMNATKRGLARLENAGATLPHPDELLTGAEFRERYLTPLAGTLSAGILHQHSPVLAIARSRMLKGDHIGQPARGGMPFRLLVRHGAGERIINADAVFDCSGTYGQPNHLGDGGIPAPGEQLCASRIYYGIPNLAGAERERFKGRRVLVVGAGHSAATVICDLASIAVGAQIHWLLRDDRELPAVEIPDDPLPERARLAATANSLVRNQRVVLHRGAAIEAIDRAMNGIDITIALRDRSFRLAVDEIIVATGFRPDLNLARELQLQTCWATEGTYPLAASMLGEAGADCLNISAGGAEMLTHPEPGYFTLGMKSYGRSPNFLLRTGYEQIETVLAFLDKQSATASNELKLASSI